VKRPAKEREAPREGWARLYERAYVIGICGCFDYGPGNIYYVEPLKAFNRVIRSTSNSTGDVCECYECGATWTRADMPEQDFWWMT